jgi:hypothetical protein
MPENLDEERSSLARTLVSLRYPIDNPAFDISATLDEPVEKIALADFYNGPAAAWLRANSTWDWVTIDASELNGVFTVRDLGKVCFAHLALRPSAATPLTEDVQ